MEDIIADAETKENPQSPRWVDEGKEVTAARPKRASRKRVHLCEQSEDVAFQLVEDDLENYGSEADARLQRNTAVIDDDDHDFEDIGPDKEEQRLANKRRRVAAAFPTFQESSLPTPMPPQRDNRASQRRRRVPVREPEPTTPSSPITPDSSSNTEAVCTDTSSDATSGGYVSAAQMREARERLAKTGRSAQISLRLVERNNYVRVLMARNPHLITRHARIKTALQFHLGWKAIHVDTTLEHDLVYVPIEDFDETYFEVPCGKTLARKVNALSSNEDILQSAPLKGYITRHLTVKRRVLKRHQAAVKSYFEHLDWRAPLPRDGIPRTFLLLWAMGAGKTAMVYEMTVGTDHGVPPSTGIQIADPSVLLHFVATLEATALGGDDEGQPLETIQDIVTESEFTARFLTCAADVDFVAVDEMQRFRNLTKPQARLLDALQDTRFLLGLSGTPLMNNAQDLLGLLRFFRQDIAWHPTDNGKVVWDGEHIEVQDIEELCRVVYGEDSAMVGDVAANIAAGGNGGGGGGGALRGSKRVLVDEELEELLEELPPRKLPGEVEVTPAMRSALTSRWSLDKLRAVVKGKISYFDPRIHGEMDMKEHYPTVMYETRRIPITLPMGLEYMFSLRSEMDVAHPGFVLRHSEKPLSRRYVRVATQSSNRYGKAEQAVLTRSDPLYNVNVRGEAIKELLEAPGAQWPVVIHSELLDAGVDAIRDSISAMVRRDTGLPVRVEEITGRTKSVKQRQATLKAFAAGDVDVLLISSAAATGTNIQGAGMFFLEPQDNVATENQTMARVLRLDSHPRGELDSVRMVKTVCVLPEVLRSTAVDLGREVEAMSLEEKLWFQAQAIGEYCPEEKRFRRGFGYHAWSDAYFSGLTPGGKYAWRNKTYEEAIRLVRSGELALPPQLDELVEHLLRQMRRHLLLMRSGLSLHERRERYSFAKDVHLQPYIAVLQDASIDMPYGTMSSALPRDLAVDDIAYALEYVRRGGEAAVQAAGEEKQDALPCVVYYNSMDASARKDLVKRVNQHVNKHGKAILKGMAATFMLWDRVTPGIAVNAKRVLEALFTSTMGLRWLEMPVPTLLENEVFQTMLLQQCFNVHVEDMLAADDSESD